MKKHFFIISSVIVLFANFSSSQVVHLTNVFDFTNSLTYKGFEKQGVPVSAYRVYFTAGNNYQMALETLDKEGTSTGIFIVDLKKGEQYLLDLREKQGFVFTLTGLDLKLKKINLKPTGKLDSSIIGACSEYRGKDRNGVEYDYCFAQNSPEVDSIFAILNAMNINFIVYPNGQKNVITKFSSSKSGVKISEFKLVDYKENAHLKFDLSKFRIMERRN